jgi:cytochrome c biogenesis protein CcmG/thiol:disulfide interchange protein DsbE
MVEEQNIPEQDQEQIEENIKPKWGRILAWGGLLALLLLVGLGLIRAQSPIVEVGSPAPDFVLTTFDDQEIRSEDLEGKVVVLNFWASWCKPCEQEAADLETAWQFYKPRGDVIFLGLAWTDTPTESAKYLDKFNITYPNGPDLGTRISQAFNRHMGVPETYIIDQNGILHHIKIGPFMSLQEITAAIDPLLQ